MNKPIMIQAENTIGIRVPTNVQTAGSQSVVVIEVTSVSITTIPITPVTADSRAEFILFICFSYCQFDRQKEERHSLNYVSRKLYYLIVSTK